jgi:hypothetical protein
MEVGIGHNACVNKNLAWSYLLRPEASFNIAFRALISYVSLTPWKSSGLLMVAQGAAQGGGGTNSGWALGAGRFPRRQCYRHLYYTIEGNLQQIFSTTSLKPRFKSNVFILDNSFCVLSQATITPKSFYKYGSTSLGQLNNPAC